MLLTFSLSPVLFSQGRTRSVSVGEQWLQQQGAPCRSVLQRTHTIQSADGVGSRLPVLRRRPRGEAKKCRKVYGVEHRDRWCTACRWKKACQRFTDWSRGGARCPSGLFTHVSLTAFCQWSREGISALSGRRLIPSHLFCKYMHVDSSPWKPQTVFFQQMFEKQSFTNAVKHTSAPLEYLFAFSAFLYFFLFLRGKKLHFIHIWYSNKSLSCASLVSAEFNTKVSTGIFFKWIIY